MRLNKILALSVSLCLGASIFASPTLPAYGEATRYTASLDKGDMTLMNKGDWRGLVKSLESKGKSSKLSSHEKAWLIFAYLFLGDCDKINDLSKLTALGDSIRPMIVHDKKQNPSELNEEQLSVSYDIFTRAYSLVCQGKPAEAEKMLANLPEGLSNDTYANFALAAIAGKNGKAQAAAQYCKRAIDLDPEFGWGYRTYGYLNKQWLNNRDEAEAAFRKALLIEPRQDEVRSMLIDILLVQNKFDQALDLANEAVRIEQKNDKGYFRLAQIYVQQWRLREATKELSTAISLNDKSAIYYALRSDIKKYQGDIEGALEDQLLATNSTTDNAQKIIQLIELSSLNYEVGNVQPAIDTLYQALNLDPKSDVTHQTLVKLLIAEKQWPQLIKEYERSIALKPDNAELHLLLGDALYMIRNDAQALEEYKKAANMNGQDPKPHRHIAALYMSNLDYAEAAKAYKRALNIDPMSVPDLVSLGFCNAQDDDYLQAEAALVTALALKQVSGDRGPQDTKREDIIRALASLLYIEGRYADAQSQFEALSALTQNTPKAREDQFLLNQAKAMSTLKEKSLQEFIGTFNNITNNKDLYRLALVQTLLRLNKPDMALQFMSAVSEHIVKKDARWLLLKAQAFRQLGSLDKATKLIDLSIEACSPTKDTQPSLLAECMIEKALIQLAHKQPQQAEATIQQAIAIYTKHPQCYTLLATIALRRKDYKEAATWIQKALEVNPYFTDAYLLAGDVYMLQKNFKEATNNYKKATELYPGLLKAHKALINSYHAQNLTDEAKQEEIQISAMQKGD
ncbi:tetratricopeptide repeat protein [bacterium]|nr:tetratricopeptide repeat protein [bacterium]QQR56592.1 MAG: tetratricopeptide repeat protein [Candidatus Melainabacteria bacterium]